MSAHRFTQLLIGAILTGVVCAQPAASEEAEGFKSESQGRIFRLRSPSDRSTANVAAPQQPRHQDSASSSTLASQSTATSSDGLQGRVTDAQPIEFDPILSPPGNLPQPRAIDSLDTPILNPPSVLLDAGEVPAQDFDNAAGASVGNVPGPRHYSSPPLRRPVRPIGLRYWVRADYLNMRIGGMRIPALITTSPAGTPPADAGILGLSSTTILLGNESIGDQNRSGARIEFGSWLDEYARSGWHAAFFGLDEDVERFRFSSNSDSFLARPFYSLEQNAVGPNADLIGLPSQVEGNASVESSVALEGAELMFRRQLAGDTNHRLYTLIGYQYFDLDDSLVIQDFKRVTGTGTGLAVGTTLQGIDQFKADNQFHGVVLGFMGSRSNCRWTINGGIRLALGSNQSTVAINGQTTSTVPLADRSSDTATTAGGLLALPSNSGEFEQSQLAVIPQLNLDLAYQMNTNVRLVAGYHFLYWSKVARSGEQIDTGIDLRQLDPVPNGNNGRPHFSFNDDDLTAHGVDLGIEYRF